MSDSQINAIIQYGTNAERIAFTPDPPLVAGNPAQTLYIWYETDNPPDTYVWDGSAWVQINIVNAITQLTGDVTAGPGTGSQVATIPNDTVTNAKLADMATPTFKGRISALSGDPEDLTVTQATSMLNAFVGDSGAGGTKGLVPAPAAGDAAANKFLHADGTFQVASAPILRAITCSVNDAAMAVGIVGEQTYVYANGTIIGWYLIANVAGDVEFDILKTTFASYDASFTSIIGAGAPPELAAVIKDSDTTLTDWDLDVTQFDVFRFELITVDLDISRLNLVLVIQED